MPPKRSVLPPDMLLNSKKPRKTPAIRNADANVAGAASEVPAVLAVSGSSSRGRGGAPASRRGRGRGGGVSTNSRGRGGGVSTNSRGRGGGVAATPGVGRGVVTIPGLGVAEATTPGTGGGMDTTPGTGGGVAMTQGTREGIAMTPGNGGGVALTPGNRGGVALTPGNSGGVAMTAGNGEGVAMTTGNGGGVATTLGNGGGVAMTPENRRGVAGARGTGRGVAPASRGGRGGATTRGGAARGRATTAIRVLTPGSRDTSPASRESSADSRQSSSTSSTGSAVVPLVKKVRLNSSNVHKEFDQVQTEDQNGNKGWASTCHHCGHINYDKICSHLKDHLARVHPEILQDVEDKDERDRQALIKKMSVDQSRNGQIKEAFLDMVIEMGLPLSTGGHPAFIKFYKSIDGDLSLPGRKATTKLIVEDKFLRMYNQMLAILERARRVHTTCDMWSSFKVSFSGVSFPTSIFLSNAMFTDQKQLPWLHSSPL